VNKQSDSESSLMESGEEMESHKDGNLKNLCNDKNKDEAGREESKIVG